MVKNVYFCNMLQFENQKIKYIVRRVLPVLALVAMIYSCASIGQPMGGDKDTTPPRFVGSTPVAGATNAKKNKISLVFDEFIKIEKATEKVVVSPPQIQQPEIKAAGKRILLIQSISLMLLWIIMRVIRWVTLHLLFPPVHRSIQWK